MVTNFPVVDGTVEGYAKLVGQEARYPVKGTIRADGLVNLSPDE